MSAKIIDGRKIAEVFRAELAVKVAQCAAKPKLAVVLVGDNEASQIYVRNKKKAAEDVGMLCDVFHFNKDASEAEIIALLQKLNEDKTVNGVIVQLPLPAHLSETRILETVSQEKETVRNGRDGVLHRLSKKRNNVGMSLQKEHGYINF